MNKSFITIFLVIFFLPLISNAQVMPQGFLIGPDGMIGSQIWSSNNLNTSVYANGETIPYYSTAVFAGKTSPASCSVDDDPINDAIYGRLYNFYAISDPRNVCPVNWHVPSTTEFSILNSVIGGNGYALKEIGTSHWQIGGGTDLYKFKAVGTGYMGTTSYSNLHIKTYFWTTNETSSGATTAYAWALLDNVTAFTQTTQGKIGGFSVRCIRN